MHIICPRCGSFLLCDLGSELIECWTATVVVALAREEAIQNNNRNITPCLPVCNLLNVILLFLVRYLVVHRRTPKRQRCPYHADIQKQRRTRKGDTRVFMKAIEYLPPPAKWPHRKRNEFIRRRHHIQQTPFYKWSLARCSPLFMRLAEDATALRAWCKQCLPDR